MKQAKLILSDGRVLIGESISVWPEVNNTASVTIYKRGQSWPETIVVKQPL